MNYKFKKKPYAHQLTALEKSWNRDNFAYFMEMGTGKTKVLIDNLSMLYDKGKVDGALVVAPLISVDANTLELAALAGGGAALAVIKTYAKKKIS